MKKIKLIISLIICYVLIFSMNVFAKEEIKPYAVCRHENTLITYSTTYEDKSYSGHYVVKKKSVYCKDCLSVVDEASEQTRKFETHQTSDYHLGKKHYLEASCICEYKHSYSCAGPPCILPAILLNHVHLQQNND